MHNGDNRPVKVKTLSKEGEEAKRDNMYFSKERNEIYAVWMPQDSYKNLSPKIHELTLQDIRDRQDKNPEYRTIFWVNDAVGMEKEFEKHKISTENIKIVQIKSIHELMFEPSKAQKNETESEAKLDFYKRQGLSFDEVGKINKKILIQNNIYEKKNNILHAVWLSEAQSNNNKPIIDKSRLQNIRDRQDVNPEYTTMLWVDNVEGMKKEFDKHKISTENINIKSINELKFEESKVLSREKAEKLNAERDKILKFFSNSDVVPSLDVSRKIDSLEKEMLKFFRYSKDEILKVFSNSNVVPSPDVSRKIDSLEKEMLKFFIYSKDEILKVFSNNVEVGANYSACSDVLRLIALYNFGGFYHDVEISCPTEGVDDSPYNVKDFFEGTYKLPPPHKLKVEEDVLKSMSEKNYFLKEAKKIHSFDGKTKKSVRPGMYGGMYSLRNAESLVKAFEDIVKATDSFKSEYATSYHLQDGKLKEWQNKMTGSGAIKVDFGCMGYGNLGSSIPDIANLNQNKTNNEVVSWAPLKEEGFNSNQGKKLMNMDNIAEGSNEDHKNGIKTINQKKKEPNKQDLLR